MGILKCQVAPKGCGACDGTTCDMVHMALMSDDTASHTMQCVDVAMQRVAKKAQSSDMVGEFHIKVEEALKPFRRLGAMQCFKQDDGIASLECASLLQCNGLHRHKRQPKRCRHNEGDVVRGRMTDYMDAGGNGLGYVTNDKT
ncbi:hypothetical protein Ancab_012633 [Ancistrocladus abbreviatus]